MTFNPLAYVQKDKYGIAAASQIAGQTIAGIPARKQAKEKEDLLAKQLEEAADLATANWADMETAYTVIKNQYAKNPNVQQLLNSGQMTKDEFRANIARLEKPTSINKKNPQAYITKLGKSRATLLKDAEDRVQQMTAGRAIGGAIAGTPAVPEQPQGVAGRGDIGPEGQMQYTGMGEDPWAGGAGAEPPPIPGQPAVPAARHQGEVTQSPEVAKLIESGKLTMQQMNQNPQFATMPTQQQVVAGQEFETREKRLEEQNLAKAEQQTFDNAIKRKRTLSGGATNIIAKKRFKVSGLKEQKGILVTDLKDTNSQIKNIDQAITEEKGKSKFLVNQDFVDELEFKKKELEEEKKETRTTINKLIKEIAIITGTEGVTEQEGDLQQQIRLQKNLVICLLMNYPAYRIY